MKWHLIEIFENCMIWNWRYIYAQFFSVYFTQDSKFVNNGYDIITVIKPKHYYFRGTWRQHNREFRLGKLISLRGK